MAGEALPKGPTPIKPEEPQRKFEVIEGGKKDDIKEEKKSKVVAGGGGRKRGLRIGAGIGAGIIAAGGVVGGLEAAGVIDVFPENQKGGNYLTEDEQGNPVAVITSETTAAESTVPVTQETAPQTTITTPETTAEVKKFEGLKIELISDPNLPKAQFEGQDGKIYIPKEVVYTDPIEGPKKMEEALLITWALTLKKQTKHPAFANIDEKDGEALLSTLRGLLNKGEVPTFELKLKDDWSMGASNAAKYKPYEVDMTKGVTIKFVGEMTNIVTYGDFYNPQFGVAKDWVDSKDFFWIKHNADNNQDIIFGGRFEVSNDGVLTIKTFSKYPVEESFCSSFGTILETIVTQKFGDTYYGKEEEKQYKPIQLIKGALFEGDKWREDGKWLEFGKPIIVRSY